MNTTTKVSTSCWWRSTSAFRFYFCADPTLVLFHPVSSLSWCYFVVLLKLSPGSSVLPNFKTGFKLLTYHSHNESNNEFSLKAGRDSGILFTHFKDQGPYSWTISLPSTPVRLHLITLNKPVHHNLDLFGPTYTRGGRCLNHKMCNCEESLLFNSAVRLKYEPWH